MILLLVGAQAGFGQNATTGTMTGVVMDAQKGVLPGATVTAVHTPTGTTYEAVTQADGHFTMQAVRVGGPYTIKVDDVAGSRTPSRRTSRSPSARRGTSSSRWAWPRSPRR